MAFLATLLVGSLAPTAVVGGSIFAAGAIGGIALSLGGSLLLSAAANALAGGSSLSATAKNIKITSREPVAPRRVIYGQQRVGGTVVFLAVDPENKKKLEMVIVLAAHSVEEIGAIYFDGKEAVPAGSTYASGKWVDVARVWRAYGADNQSAFEGLREYFPEKWTAAHQLRGCAAIRVRLTFDADAYPNGVPNITCDIRGKNDIFDPRDGSRGFSDNPALCIADYLANPWFGLGAVYGENIDTLSLIESANICDELVALADGGSQRRYKLDGAIDTSVAPQGVVRSMLTAMAGDVATVGGVHHILAGAYRAPVLHIVPDDIRQGGLRIATRIARADNCNAVRGTFVSPENDWAVDDFPAYASDYYLAEDNGERRWRDIELPFTINPTRAQRLAKIELERTRRQITVELAGKIRCWAAGPGDVVTLSHPKRGFDEKPFVVQSVRLDVVEGQLLPVLMLRETSPLVYDWLASEAKIYAAAPRTDLPDPFDVDPPGVPILTEALYDTRSAGGVKTKLSVAWAASPTAAVAAYDLRATGPDGRRRALNGLQDLEAELLDVMPGEWLVEVRAVTAIGVRSRFADSAASIVVRGLLAKPTGLTGVSLQSAGGLAVLKWALHADLDVRVGGHVVIRHSASVAPVWDGSTALDEVAGAQTLAVCNLLPGAYLLRARDSLGQLGPVSVVLSDGAQVLAFSPLSTLQEDDEFAGVHSGTYVSHGLLSIGSSGDLYASDDLYAEPSLYVIGGHVLPSATYDFASAIDLGAVKSVRARRDVELLSVSINADIYAEADLWATSDLYQSIGDTTDVVVEIATTPDDPASSVAVWADWRRIDAAEIVARGIKARAILTTENPLVAPFVSRLRLITEEVAA